MKEEWKTLKHNRYKPNTVIAISNYGRIQRFDGSIDVTDLRSTAIRFNGKLMRAHVIIATLFIPKTNEDIKLNRCIVDHITHHPTGINVNDVRNLRWCTAKENHNFDEAKVNHRKCRLGKPSWNKGLKGAEYISHYKNGVRNSNLNKHQEIEPCCHS